MKSAKKYMDLLVKSYMIPERLPIIAVSTYLAGYFFGEEGLAIYSFLLPIYFLSSISGYAINAGALNLSLRAVGRSDSERARQFSSEALFFSIVTGATLSILIGIFLESIVRFLGVPSELHDLAMDYGRPMILLTFLLVVSNYVTQFMKLVGLQTQFRFIYKVLLIFNGLAIIICVKLLDLGIESISIGMSVATVVFIIYGAIQLRSKFRTNLFAPIDFSRLEIFNMIRERSALTMSKIGLLLQTVIYNHFLMMTLGVEAVAIYAGMHMAIRLCRTGSDMALQPMNPVLTIELADKNLPACMLLLKTAIKRGLIFAILFTIIILIVTDHEAYKFYAASLIPAAILAIMIASYLPTRHEIFANLIALSRALILPIAFLIGAYQTDPNLVWWSFPIAEFGTLIIMLLGIKIMQKSRNLVTPLLLDPKDFPKTIFFVVDRAEGISEDQKSRIDPKLLPIIEEWIRLSREHSDLKKNNFTAVQISGDSIVMRSNGKRFDYRSVIPSSMLKDLDWNFKFVLGLNNLYLRKIRR